MVKNFSVKNAVPDFSTPAKECYDSCMRQFAIDIENCPCGDNCRGDCPCPFFDCSLLENNSTIFVLYKEGDSELPVKVSDRRNIIKVFECLPPNCYKK